jgi:hypothetical protein
MNKLKTITRDRYLTKEEASKYNKIREDIKKELPELIERHFHRMPRSKLDILDVKNLK